MGHAYISYLHYRRRSQKHDQTHAKTKMEDCIGIAPENRKLRMYIYNSFRFRSRSSIFFCTMPASGPDILKCGCPILTTFFRGFSLSSALPSFLHRYQGSESRWRGRRQFTGGRRSWQSSR